LGVLMTVLSAATAASWIYPALAASALAQGHPAAAGWLEAAVAAGSVTGGLLWARRRHTRPRHSHLAGLLALQATGLAVAAVVAHRPHDLGSPTLGLSALGVASALAGLGVAPLFVVAYLAADDLAPPERRIEAGTWVNVVANVGSAAGSAAGGFLTQMLGPSAALIGAALLATAAAITATRRRRSARFSHIN
jgi:MFS family permease